MNGIFRLTWQSLLQTGNYHHVDVNRGPLRPWHDVQQRSHVTKEATCYKWKCNVSAGESILKEWIEEHGRSIKSKMKAGDLRSLRSQDTSIGSPRVALWRAADNAVETEVEKAAVVEKMLVEEGTVAAKSKKRKNTADLLVSSRQRRSARRSLSKSKWTSDMFNLKKLNAQKILQGPKSV